MSATMVIALVGFVALSVMAYLALLIFWPEWLGISGAKTRAEYEARKKVAEEERAKASEDSR